MQNGQTLRHRVFNTGCFGTLSVQCHSEVFRCIFDFRQICTFCIFQWTGCQWYGQTCRPQWYVFIVYRVLLTINCSGPFWYHTFDNLASRKWLIGERNGITLGPANTKLLIPRPKLVLGSNWTGDPQMIFLPWYLAAPPGDDHRYRLRSMMAIKLRWTVWE